MRYFGPLAALLQAGHRRPLLTRIRLVLVRLLVQRFLARCSWQAVLGLLLAARFVALSKRLTLRLLCRLRDKLATLFRRLKHARP